MEGIGGGACPTNLIRPTRDCVELLGMRKKIRVVRQTSVDVDE